MNDRDSLRTLNYPDFGNMEGWKSFCLEKYSKQVESSKNEDSNPDHSASSAEVSESGKSKGTPPLLKVVLPMSQPQVVDLLTYQIQWLGNDGYSVEIMQWIFALLSVLEKPLDPDMCSALRNLARTCRQMRSSLGEGDPVIRELSWFICIIGRYFDQNDLADSYCD